MRGYYLSSPWEDPVSHGGATLKDLAEKLDVSIATVSRALAGHDRIAKSTRARIEAAAREIGYIPNRAARALVSGRSGFAAMVLPAEEAGGEAVPPGLLRALSAGCAQIGMDFFLASVPPGQSELAVIEQIVRARKADGLLLLAAGDDDPRLAFLAQRRFPFVTLGSPPRGAPAQPWVDTDGFAAFERAFTLLRGLGHRRFGLVGPSDPSPSCRRRHDGLLAAIARSGDTSIEVGSVALRGDDIGRSRRAIRALLSRPARPTAVLGLTDAAALDVMEEAERLGLSVPRDLSVIGFGNDPAAAHFRPGLTTFDADPVHCASCAAELLAEQIEAGPDATPPLARVLRPRLVIRSSHGPAPQTGTTSAALCESQPA